MNTEFITELNGSTVRLLVFGQIGKLVARKLESFSVNILVYDPYVSDAIIKELACHSVDFETISKGSDILSVHMRLTPETRIKKSG